MDISTVPYLMPPDETNYNGPLPANTTLQQVQEHNAKVCLKLKLLSQVNDMDMPSADPPNDKMMAHDGAAAGTRKVDPK